MKTVTVKMPNEMDLVMWYNNSEQFFRFQFGLLSGTMQKINNEWQLTDGASAIEKDLIRIAENAFI